MSTNDFSSVVIPDNDELKQFLSPENLSVLGLPFPASDFNLPGIGECCVEELSVVLMDCENLDPVFFVYHLGKRNDNPINRDDVSFSEYLGLLAIWITPDVRESEAMSTTLINLTPLGDDIRF